MMQIMCLGKQMYPNASCGFLQAYKSATERPYGYLLLVLRGTTSDHLRLRGCCFGEMGDNMERCYEAGKTGAAVYVLIPESELKELRRLVDSAKKACKRKEKELPVTMVRRIEPIPVKRKNKKRLVEI